MMNGLELYGEAGESISINLQTGKWAEFNGLGAKGGDVVSLFAAKFCNGKQGEAARFLADKIGINIKRPKPKPKRDKEQWTSLIPLPPDAGLPPDAALAGFDAVHRYTSLDGHETHVVGRVEARGDKRKRFIPVTYGVLNGVRGWQTLAPDAPRPLYGLHKLVAMPGASEQQTQNLVGNFGPQDEVSARAIKATKTLSGTRCEIERRSSSPVHQ